MVQTDPCTHLFLEMANNESNFKLSCIQGGGKRNTAKPANPFLLLDSKKREQHKWTFAAVS